MVAVLEQETAPATIEATVNYIFDNGEKLFTQTGGPGAHRRAHRRHARPAPRHHPQRAARTETISRSTAKVSRFSRTSRPWSTISTTPTRCARVYYAEVAALVKDLTGAARVVAFDHNGCAAPTRAERDESGAQDAE